jgi:hypothetical protein
VPLASATPRRAVRARVRARGHANPTPPRHRAPQHARMSTPGARLNLGPLFSRVGLTAAFGTAAPLRPCRGRVPRAHGRSGEGERHRFFGHREHTLPPAEPRARTREPTAGAVLAATHGVDPGSAAFPAATPLSRPTPSLAVVVTLRARSPAHAIARVSRAPHWFRSPTPSPRRRRRAHACDGLTRRSPPRSCAPSSPAA